MTDAAARASEQVRRIPLAMHARRPPFLSMFGGRHPFRMQRFGGMMPLCDARRGAGGHE
jgi:hypothetical protein